MAALVIAIIRYAVAAAGIFTGYFLFFTWRDARPALEVVSLTCVGINGILSFISHVVFHEEDARRLGLDSAHPGFQFEVGFFNLSVGLLAVFSFLLSWGPIANAVLLLGYALYILQAVMFHLSRYLAGKKRGAGYLWGSIVAAGLYSGNMLFFALATLFQEQLLPF